YVLLGHFSVNSIQRFVYAKRCQRFFLYYGAFSNFFTHYLKIDKINLKRHIGTVLYLRMEIVFTVMDINPFQYKLDAETLGTDVLYDTFIFFVNGFHNQSNKRRGTIAQF